MQYLIVWWLIVVSAAITVVRGIWGQDKFWNWAVEFPEVRVTRLVIGAMLFGIVAPLVLVGIDFNRVCHEFQVWQIAGEVDGIGNEDPEEAGNRFVAARRILATIIASRGV